MSDWLARLATDRGVMCVVRGGDILFSRQQVENADSAQLLLVGARRWECAHPAESAPTPRGGLWRVDLRREERERAEEKRRGSRTQSAGWIALIESYYREYTEHPAFFREGVHIVELQEPFERSEHPPPPPTPPPPYPHPTHTLPQKLIGRMGGVPRACTGALMYLFW
jgi:hypothetical protein